MTTPLSEEEIKDALSTLPGWEYHSDKITKTFQLQSFREAMAFLVRIAFSAEEADHHPEIYNLYNRVTISLNTHHSGGKVTIKDIKLARSIENFNWIDPS